MEKDNKAVHLRLFFAYLHQNLFNIKKHLALVLKKVCPFTFLCILLEENLAWLTQKTEEPKSNKGNFTFPKHTVNVIKSNRNKSEVIKHWEPPPFLHQPPLFRFISSPFLGEGSPMKIAVHCPIWCW